jgi:hypothetical protein
MGTLGPEVGVFRASFRSILGLSGFVAFALLPLVIRRVHGAGWGDWRVVAAGFGALLLVPLLLYALLAPFVWWFRVRVHELGLRAFDAWGRRLAVRWTEMTTAERLDLPGMPYLRVRTREEGVELVVPLFLARRDAFVRAVTARAGPSNPMSRYFAGEIAKAVRPRPRSG